MPAEEPAMTPTQQLAATLVEQFHEGLTEVRQGRNFSAKGGSWEVYAVTTGFGDNKTPTGRLAVTCRDAQALRSFTGVIRGEGHSATQMHGQLGVLVNPGPA